MSQVGPRVAGGKGNLRDRNLWPSGAWYHSLRSKTCPVFNSHSSELLDSLAILGPCLQPETAFSCSKCTFTEMTAQLLTHTGLLLSVACIPWCGRTISSFVRFEIKIHSARKYFRFFPLGGGSQRAPPVPMKLTSAPPLHAKQRQVSSRPWWWLGRTSHWQGLRGLGECGRGRARGEAERTGKDW